MATHVLSVDIIDRQILKKSTPSYSYSNLNSDSSEEEEESQDDPLILRTTRLILKRGTLPRWAPKGVIKNTLSWVLEESEIELDLYDSLNAAATASTSSSTDSNNLGDAVLNPPEGLPGRTMRVWTRNLDHTTAMAVTEGILMKESVEFQDRKVFEKAKGKGKAREVAGEDGEISENR